MARESERMQVLKQNFMALHQEGFTIPEIADKFNVSFSHLYRSLQEIADANGVTRASLLQIVRTPSPERQLRDEHRQVRVDVEELRNGFQGAGNIMDQLLSKIEAILEEEKNYGEYDG